MQLVDNQYSFHLANAQNPFSVLAKSRVSMSYVYFNPFLTFGAGDNNLL
jgi:hypothetical protein